GEEADTPPVDGAEAGGRVRNALADDQRDHTGEVPNSDSAGEGAAIELFACEAGADHEIGAALDDRDDQPKEVLRIVLPVAVDLDGEVEIVLERVLVSRLHRAADAQVVRKSDHAGPGT